MEKYSISAIVSGPRIPSGENITYPGDLLSNGDLVGRFNL